MYGRGNYAPQFPQAPQRPMAFSQQQQGGIAPPPFPQRPPLQSQQLIQQPGLPHAVQPVPSAVQPGPSAQIRAPSIVPPPMPQQRQLSNLNQYYIHQRPISHGNAYPSSFQNPMHPSHMRPQNVHFAPPPPAHPQVPSFGPSRAPLPPPSSQTQQMFALPMFPTPPLPPPQFTPLPPPPRTSGNLFRPVGDDRTSQTVTGRSNVLSLPAPLPPPPPSSPPPSPPPPPPPPLAASSFSPSVPASSPAPSKDASHSVLESDAGLISSQAPDSDGSDALDIPLQANDSTDDRGTTVQGLLVYDGSALSAPFHPPPPPTEACDEIVTENMSSMKCVAENYSPADSDIDMEDDITQFDRDEMGAHSAEEQKQDQFTSGCKFDMLTQDAVRGSRDDRAEGKWSPLLDSRADDVIKSARSPDQILSASPFRLIQNYVSDDSSDDGGDDVSCREFNATTAYKVDATTTSHGDVIDGSSKSELPENENNLRDSKSSRQCNAIVREIEAELVVAGGMLSEKDDERAGEEAKAEALSSTSSGSLRQVNTSSKGSFEIVSDGIKVPKENTRKTPVKVDEFGRLVREDISESESDDSDKNSTRRRRGRSRSRSQSPQYRRRRRTPSRREARRSRSRSWSPRKRRISRSPSRRSSVLEVDRQRRGRAKIGECFNFLKGRCYYGASCRYLHHGLDNCDRSGHVRSRKQNLEVPQSSRNSDSDKEYKDTMRRPFLEDEAYARDRSPGNDMFPSKHSASQDTTVSEVRKTEAEVNAIQTSVNQDDEANIYCEEKLGNSGEVNTGLFAQPPPHEAPGVSSSLLLEDVEYQKTSVSSINDAASQHALANVSAQEHHVVDNNHPEVDRTVATLSPQEHHVVDHAESEMDRPVASVSAAFHTSASASLQLPISEPYSSKVSNDISGQENPLASGSSSAELRHHGPQLPFPPLQQPSRVDAPHVLHSLGAQNSLALNVSDSLLQPSAVNMAPYQDHSSNQRLYPVPSSQLWTTSSPYVMDSAISGAPLQFQRDSLPVRNELMRPIPNELPGHSEVMGLHHHTNPSLQGPLQPPSHVVELHKKPSLAGSVLIPQSGVPSLLRDDSYTHLPSHGSVSSSLFPPGSVPSHPSTFYEDIPSVKLQSVAFHDHRQYQCHQVPHGLQQGDSHNISSYLPGPVASTRYPADLRDQSQPSSLSDIGVSRITAHHNPYASTFDQPLNLKFGFRMDRDSHSHNYDAPYASVPVSAEGQGVRSLDVKLIVSPKNSFPGVGQAFQKSGGDQYDPFEPASESSKKHVSNYGSMVKLSSSHKLSDMDENKMVNNEEDLAASISVENDEFGETADAEVGAVENGSGTNPNDEADASAGVIEIDQVRPKEKSKKGKDSRSMKLFQAELANFVKEVLKPSWRQGNMSKEAFKTIVKKTVDKVSAAMKNQRMPKSKENISRYIDSSHRKLTRLVEGYVTKYAKA